MHPTTSIFDTNGHDFDTISDEEKVPYLKIDRGRYFYQRRVPLKMQAHLGIHRWQLPCGDVSYSKAVQMVVTWAEEHDELISNLRDPDRLQKAHVWHDSRIYCGFCIRHRSGRSTDLMKIRNDPTCCVFGHNFVSSGHTSDLRFHSAYCIYLIIFNFISYPFFREPDSRVAHHLSPP